MRCDGKYYENCCGDRVFLAVVGWNTFASRSHWFINS